MSRIATSLFLSFLMIFLGLSAVTNTLNQSTESKTLEMFDEPLNVILPLSQLNEPGFQEGDVLTNATLTTVSSKTCVIIDNGTVSCWGNNYNGGLGDGTTTSKSSPTQTSSLGTGRTAVAISGSCAILDNGNVSCWGFNSYGMVGDGTNNQRTTPTQTSSLGNGRTAVAISTGSGHVCAILDDGSVSCWGRNAQGVIGDGTSTNRLSPTQTLSLGTNREAVAISSGGYHTCVILDDGSVSCWGYDGYGQLGTTSGSSTNYPQQTSSLGTGRTAVAISSGESHTCAILDDGTVSCWGANNNGQLGDGTTTRRYSPTQTSSLGSGRTAVAISSGEYHTCAILDDGSTSCWGRNDYGQLGDGTMTQRNTPTQITSLMTGPTAVAISAANGYTCAILNNGSASCWGYNHKGQLGDGTTNDHISTTQTLDIGIGRTVALSDFDIDGDGFLNHFEDFPNDSTENKDSDGDGIGDNSDTCPLDADNDADADGVCGDQDAFPNDPSETVDSDGDGVGDNSDICPLDADNDADADGVCGDQDAFPNDSSETVDSDGDGVGDNGDEFPNDASETIDSDSDGVGDNSDDFPNDPSETMDSDGDGVGDNADDLPNDDSETIDSDADGVGDNSDEFPNDSSETMDSDLDGIGDNADNDDDNDGIIDSEDAFPVDPNESEDSDMDGVGDNSDAFPNDSSETMDSDLDGIGDNADIDDDNDGVIDSEDAFPYDASETTDTDGDGIGDNIDPRNDNEEWIQSVYNWAEDLYLDYESAWDNYSQNCSECSNEELDEMAVDDYININEVTELENLTSGPYNMEGYQFYFQFYDLNGNDIHDTGEIYSIYCTNNWNNEFIVAFNGNVYYTDFETFWTDVYAIDLDSDGDGVLDFEDVFPYDSNETMDSDNDSVGDNGDVFPHDSNESMDSDMDGIGDNADEFPYDASETTDTDGDGVGDNSDVFPNDPSETMDFDGDGLGDNSDVCPYDYENDADEDGVCGNIIYVGTWPDGGTQENPNGSDDVDAFPYDPSETMDSDNDGIGNNADNDDDNDGVMDYDDAFPYDPSETMDSDLDGIGDNADNDDDNDGIIDLDDAFPIDPYESQDSDYDGVGDNSDMFPNDSSETMDSDGDGVGDNSDEFPNGSTEWLDTDGDGVGDNSDEFPNDPTEWSDTDGDGVGDNSQNSNTNDDGNNTDTGDNGNNTDTVDSGDNVTDVDDITPSDPTEPGDTVNNGTDDNIDDTDDAIAEPITDDDSSVPGFTGILATIALLGAIYIRRDD